MPFGYHKYDVWQKNPHNLMNSFQIVEPGNMSKIID